MVEGVSRVATFAKAAAADEVERGRLIIYQNIIIFGIISA